MDEGKKHHRPMIEFASPNGLNDDCLRHLLLILRSIELHDEHAVRPAIHVSGTYLASSALVMQFCDEFNLA
jgi:hypothetical protein